MYGAQQSVAASSSSLDQCAAYSANDRLGCVSASAATSTHTHGTAAITATTELLQIQTPEFNSTQPWPPNSPDLNPVDLQRVGNTAREGVQEAKLSQRDRATAA